MFEFLGIKELTHPLHNVKISSGKTNLEQRE